MRQLLEGCIRPISTAVFERIGASRAGHELTPRGLHVVYNTKVDVGYKPASETRWGAAKHLLQAAKKQSSSRSDSRGRSDAGANGGSFRRANSGSSLGSSKRLSRHDSARAADSASTDDDNQRQTTALRSALGGKRGHRQRNKGDRSSDHMMDGCAGYGGRGGLHNHEQMDMQNTATVGASLM